MSYCPNCGKSIEPNANFCSSCGAAMKPAIANQASEELPLPPPPPDYVAPANGRGDVPQSQPEPSPFVEQHTWSDGEQTIGVIPHAKKMKSLGRYDSFALVVTTRRMIADIGDARRCREQRSGEGEERGQRLFFIVGSSAEDCVHI